jgi:hypothetical protein
MQITTPTILTVYNSKANVISSTVIDYGQTDQVHKIIGPLCEANQWHYSLNVPPVWNLFIDNLNKAANSI